MTAPCVDGTLRAVTADRAAIPATQESLGAPADAAHADAAHADADDGPLYCYRHPASETYVRCGRCDQPICPKCAVQGPVGFRCRQCGLVKSATISDFTPQKLAYGLAVSIGGGAILGYLGGQLGFYSIFVAFFAGAFIAEGFVRAVGLKRGPTVRSMLYGGLALGFAVGAILQISMFWGSVPMEEELPLEFWLQSMLPYLAIGLGAAIAGAYSRVRWF